MIENLIVHSRRSLDALKPSFQVLRLSKSQDLCHSGGICGPGSDPSALSREALRVPKQDGIEAQELGKGLAVPVAAGFARPCAVDRAPEKSPEGKAPRIVQSDDQIATGQDLSQPVAIGAVQNPGLANDDLLHPPDLLILGHLHPVGFKAQIVHQMDRRPGEFAQTQRQGRFSRARDPVGQNAHALHRLNDTP